MVFIFKKDVSEAVVVTQLSQDRGKVVFKEGGTVLIEKLERIGNKNSLFSPYLITSQVEEDL